jgi:ParB/RepB/Spo0J family partition protein
MKTLVRQQVLLSLIDFEDVQFRFRKNFKEDTINKLMLSIKKEGLSNPVKLRLKNNGKHQIFAGWQRTEAVKRLGLLTILADVYIDISDEEAYKINVIDNSLRENLNDVETADQIANLRKTVNPKEIAELYGFSVDRIYDLLKLAKMPQDIRDAVEAEMISLRHAVLIDGFGDLARAKMLEKTIQDKLSVDRLQKEAMLSKHPFYLRHLQADKDVEVGRWHAFRFPHQLLDHPAYIKRWEMITKPGGVLSPSSCEFTNSGLAHDCKPPYVCKNHIEWVVLAPGQDPKNNLRKDVADRWLQNKPLEERDGWFFWCTDCIKLSIPNCVFHSDLTYLPWILDDRMRNRN